MIISKKGIGDNFRLLLLLCIWLAGNRFCLAQQAKEEEFVLSDRVGNLLDSNEIEYFNVFPDFDFIKSAVYRKDNLGNVRFLLSSADGRDTTVTISGLAANELSKLIGRFEDVADSNKIINWKLLPGFDKDKLNYFEGTGRNVTVYSSAGTFTGRMLMVGDSSLCIWLRKGDFQPEDCSRFIRRFHYSEIRSLEIRPSFSTKLMGASIGAGLAVAAIQLGMNISDKEDYLFSSNSLFILGIGGLAGAVGGFFFDGISSIGRFKEINGDAAHFKRTREKIRSHAMFDKVFPPELVPFR